MKTILTYGTFDLFHIGHLRLFERLNEIGDKLIVGVSTDEFNRIKGKDSIFTFEQRFEIIKSIKYVDFVLPEESWEQKYDDIKKYKVDIFAIGEDWKGKFDALNNFCEVLYLPRTKEVSSSKIKTMLYGLKSSQIEQIKEALDLLQNVAKDLE